MYKPAIPNSGTRTGNLVIFVFGLLLMKLVVLPQLAAAEALPPTSNCGKAAVHRVVRPQSQFYDGRQRPVIFRLVELQFELLLRSGQM